MINPIELTANLLRGARQIDLMRKEVEEIVAMICGYALKCGSASSRDVSLTFTSDSCAWVVTGGIGHMASNCNKLKVDCWLRMISRPGHHETLGYTTVGGIPFHTDRVNMVHCGLPVFVAGMLKEFPELEKHWEPLIKASQAKLYRE